MKTRQQRAQILSLLSEGEASVQEWQNFIQKNASLLQGFILHFPAKTNPLSTGLHDLCLELGLLYTVGSLHTAESSLESSEQDAKIIHSSARPAPSIPPTSASPKAQKAPSPLTLIHKVRSGEEIFLESGGVILGDVAHGSQITARGSLIVFGDCAGVLHIGGDFLVLRRLTSGYISLQDSLLQEPIIAKINASNHLKIIIKSSDTIAVKEIL